MSDAGGDGERITETLLVNGVFQGGGAKSIAYGGALRALRSRNLWFGSVAGASAGAITATLIASGMSVEELETATPKVLAATSAPIVARLGKASMGWATSLFEGAGLRRWLDATLAERIGSNGEHPVTFKQLHAATGIELYVLALDLATELPVIFNRRTTPDVEVAGAVVSSSAIPGGFPAGRAVFSDSRGGARVHQLIDGAGWANYPGFIFQDQAFRTWIEGESRFIGDWTDRDTAAWADESARPVIGFVLGDDAAPETRRSIGFVPLDGPNVDRRFDLGPTYTSRKRLTYLIGATLSSDWVRLAGVLALLVWATMAVSTAPLAFRRFSTWLEGWMPDALFPVALVGALTISVFAIVTAVGLIVFVLLASRLLADTLLPAIKASLGVPADVPPWTSLGNDSIVLRVPDEGLKTIDFSVDPAERERAIEAARVGVLRQLEQPEIVDRLGALFAGQTPPSVVHAPSSAPAAQSNVPSPTPISNVVLVLVSTAAMAGLSWWATTRAGSASIVEIVAALGVAVIGAVVAFGSIGRETGRRAHARASDGASPARRTRPEWLAAVGVGLLIAAVALSWSAMGDRSDSTYRAEVVEAFGAPSRNMYVLDVDGADDPATLSSKRHLRLGEAVLLSFDDQSNEYELADTLNDIRFGVAMMAIALALVLLTSAARIRRWERRCRRLDDLLATWATG